jgi:hypothetical protein
MRAVVFFAEQSLDSSTGRHATLGSGYAQGDAIRPAADRVMRIPNPQCIQGCILMCAIRFSDSPQVARSCEQVCAKSCGEIVVKEPTDK